MIWPLDPSGRIYRLRLWRRCRTTWGPTDSASSSSHAGSAPSPPQGPSLPTTSLELDPSASVASPSKPSRSFPQLQNDYLGRKRLLSMSNLSSSPLIHLPLRFLPFCLFPENQKWREGASATLFFMYVYRERVRGCQMIEFWTESFKWRIQLNG